MSVKILFCVVAGLLFEEICGHGMLLEPPNRSSLWRYELSDAINYDDQQLFCGGGWVQWGLNDGQCGVCGDSYTDPHPQANENTGYYGSGRIVRTYESGSVIDVEVLLTTSHLGTFEFHLCKLTNSNAPESGEDCFTGLSLADGTTKYDVQKSDSTVNLRVQLPEVTCAHCVLRWHYRTGNSVGDCGDGTYEMGCGAQETFRNCADIAII